MDIQVFDPREKIFEFNLDIYSCYRCYTGECSLENISIEEIESYSSTYINAVASIEYCREMAKLFLNNKFTAPAIIYYNEKCSHYSFSDGQHRTCVVAHLLRKGARVNLNATITNQKCLCKNCLLTNKYIEEENSFNFIDRYFKTRKYKKHQESKKKFQEHEFLKRL